MVDNFYKKLFFIYYNAAKKYYDDSSAIFYSSVILGLIIMMMFICFWEASIIYSESLRAFSKSNYDFDLYLSLFLAATVSILNIKYFKLNNNYKKIDSYYKNVVGYKINILVYLKFSFIPIGIFVVMTLLGTYIRYKKWFF